MHAGVALDAEAEQLSTVFFAATHSPVAARLMTYVPPGIDGAHVGALRPGDAIAETEILAQFMVGADGFAYARQGFGGNMFMPVIGPVGSGKTHLIKWLSSKIPNTENRRVILIPKLNTSLKAVLSLMIGDLPGEEFDRVRTALRVNPNDGLDADDRRKHLLSFLEVAVGKGANDMLLTDTERYIRTGLPGFLRDEFIRSHLLQTDGFIDRLASHALGVFPNANGRPLGDLQIEFTVGDLKLGLSKVDVRARAGDVARNFFFQLCGDEEMSVATVKWVNEKRADAIGGLLQLSNINLEQLMKSARQQLKRDGVELIVLIEDYARLQGVDTALLEALLARPHQVGEDDLCAIRVALACTDGHYDRVPDTARSRAQLHIQVGGLVDDSGAQILDWSMFAGRYLNALRIPVSTNDDQPAGVSNPCQRCQYQEACHKAFGSVRIALNHGQDEEPSEVGLYPFNSSMLSKTRERRLANFNARTATQQVLKPVLATFAGLIPENEFPPRALVAAFGGLKISAPVSKRLEAQADSERQISLAELWSSTGDERGVSNDVRVAFGVAVLPECPEPQVVHPLPEGPTVVEGVVAAPPVEDKWTRLVPALNDWANGTPLPASAVADLREVVFSAIEQELDWIGNGLYQEFYAHKTGALFKRVGICFNGDNHGGAIGLQIPAAANEKIAMAVALQALVTRKSCGDWSFDEGVNAYIAARNQVAKWAGAVLAQILENFGPGSLLDPIPPAVESLCLFQMLSAKTVPVDCTDENALNFLFGNITPPDDGRSQSWKSLQGAMESDINLVRTALLKLIGARKGDGSVHVLSPDRVLPLIRKALQTCVASDFKLLGLQGAGSGVEGVALRSCNALLRKQLPDALDKEIAESNTSCEAVEELFDLAESDELNLEVVAKDLKYARDAVAVAQQLGEVGGNKQPDEIRQAIDALETAGLVELLAACRAVRSANGGGRLPAVAQVPADKRRQVLNAVEVLSQFLSSTRSGLKSACDRHEQVVGIDIVLSKIETQLKALILMTHSPATGGGG